LLEDNDRVVDFVKPFAELGSAVVESLGVGLIVLFSFYALGLAAFRLFKGRQYDPLFKEARQKLGRGILVGLEFLVAADIIHTVAVDLSFQTVGVLTLIVLIRTFLSFTLEVELTGKWPWQNQET
jgi:uncharacterized membrane protein